MTNKRSIIFVDGGKGGVGKSLVSSVLVDYFHAHNQTPLLIEGDSTIPDVARRFKDINGVTYAVASLAGDDAELSVSRLLKRLETDEQQVTIVNLPAGAGEVLNNLVDLISDVSEALEIEVCTAFVLDDKSDSVRLLSESQEIGLASISASCLAILNGHFGKDQSQFNWFNSDERKGWIEAGFDEIYLPKFSNEIVSHFVTGAWSELAKNTEISVVDRSRIHRFLKQAHKIGQYFNDKKEGGEDE